MYRPHHLTTSRAMQTLFGSKVDDRTTYPLSAQHPTEGDIRALREYRSWPDEVTVWLIRIATPGWDVVKLLPPKLEGLLASCDEPYGLLIPSRERDEGYGSTLLAYVPDHERALLASMIQELQDGEHGQFHDAIRNKMRGV